MVQPAAADGRIDQTLVQALKAAHRVLETVGLTPAAVKREAQAPVDAYSRKLCRLAFLAPDIQAAILEGRQPPQMTLARLINGEVALAWGDQCPETAARRIQDPAATTSARR